MKRPIALLTLGIACSIAGSASALPPCVTNPIFLRATTWPSARLIGAVQLRDGPGTQCRVTGMIPPGPVTATCGLVLVRAHPSTDWCQVQSATRTGWVPQTVGISNQNQRRRF